MVRTSTHEGGRGTYIKVGLLKKARKGDIRDDVITIDINSLYDRISGVLTEGEALIIAEGLIAAVIHKQLREKRI